WVRLGVSPARVDAASTAVGGELFLVGAQVRRRAGVCKECPVLFERKAVRLEGGEEAEAYFMDRTKVGGKRRIWNGDWRNRFAPKPRESAAGPFVTWAKGRVTGRRRTGDGSSAARGVGRRTSESDGRAPHDLERAHSR